ncbi:hypothetical protein [Pseudomonas sp. AM14(2022)]|uniref:hypothetical protein n=1 Tax=Pseudomonas sp. AM14(2022) TaxID=2983371 RepID=UPI002E8165BB|nr:hypothetical protein [Pseudomonas sp. AM14(2022)]
MKRSFDWKYLLATALAVVGLAIPVYLWQFDLQSHDLSARLVSSSSLQPFASAKIYDVKVTLNGVQLANPHFTSFELINSGSKPILNSDFESPIELSGNNGLEFVSARVDYTDPKEIPVKISVDSKHVSISPFLFNPKDKVVFSVITSGANPVISIRARIAGIREITFVDASVDRGSPTRLATYFILGLSALAAYFSYILIIPKRRSILLDWRFALASTVGCGLGGILAMGKVVEDLDRMFGGVSGYAAWISGGLVAFGVGAGDVIVRKLRLIKVDKGDDDGST